MTGQDAAAWMYRYYLTQELERLNMISLRSDLTQEQKLEAARIGRIQFKSAGAVRRDK